MAGHEPLEHISTFGGQCDRVCLELLIDNDADEQRRVVIIDDFGALIRIGPAQQQVLISEVKENALDKLLIAEAS